MNRHSAFGLSRLNRRRVLSGAAGLAVASGLSQRFNLAAAQQMDMDHPAHIHKGTCAALDPNPAFPLSDIVLTGSATPEAGATSALPVVSSMTTVPVALNDLLASPYAINVHESATAIGHYLACGDIGGTPVNDTLTIGLRLLGTDGYAGIATLHANGDQTDVTLELVVGLPPVAAETTEQATPLPGTTSVAITLIDMKVESEQTTFKVDQPYTFVITNNGHSVHEFVIEKRDAVDEPLLESGQQAEASNIGSGQTATLAWTFTEPGAYKFSCHLPGHYEAGMTLNIDVTA